MRALFIGIAGGSGVGKTALATDFGYGKILNQAVRQKDNPDYLILV